MKAAIAGALLAILALAYPAAASVSVGPDSLEIIHNIYTAGENISGSALISFDAPIQQNSELLVYRDSALALTKDLSQQISSLVYSYKPVPFSFDLAAAGTNHWKEYPQQFFNYRVSAAGTCGSSQPQPCSCDSPGSQYSCDWDVTPSSDRSALVAGDEGMKFIINGLDIINPPESANPDTVWSILSNSNPSVTLRMSQACGGSAYSGYTVFDDGWVRRTLLSSSPSEFQPIGGTTSRVANIEPFEAQSLYANFTQFGGGGGIFAGGTRLNKGSQVEFWSNGTIIVKDFDPFTQYTISYLPPNGPMLCATTAASQQKSQPWTSSYTVQESTSKDSPFKRNYTSAELSFLLPPPSCSSGVAEQDCNRTVSSYSAAKSTGNVTFSFNPQTYAASATTESNTLKSNESILVPLSSIPAGVVGNHTLNFTLLSNGLPAANSTMAYSVLESGSVVGEPKITADYKSTAGLGEDLAAAVSVTGTTGVVELQVYYNSQKIGSIKKTAPLTLNIIIPSPPIGAGTFTAVAIENQENFTKSFTFSVAECTAGSKPCGSNIGVCRQGIQSCEGGKWGACIGDSKPKAESCNGIDDDCDGTIDNTGSSSAESACGCYGGGIPGPESCNDIDDNCDGQVDEGLSCCSDMETRPCGTSVGVCQPGVERCLGGSWSGLCLGSIKPINEICYDSLDNNCNGEADESCDLSYSCSNGLQDANEDGIDCGLGCGNPCGAGFNYLLLTAIGLFIIILVIVAAKRGIIKL